MGCTVIQKLFWSTYTAYSCVSHRLHHWVGGATPRPWQVKRAEWNNGTCSASPRLFRHPVDLPAGWQRLNLLVTSRGFLYSKVRRVSIAAGISRVHSFFWSCRLEPLSVFLILSGPFLSSFFHDVSESPKNNHFRSITHFHFVLFVIKQTLIP